MLEQMPESTNNVSVIDFRRARLVLNWHTLGGTWTACDVPPTLVHGIALIRAAQPNICIYGQGGRLKLQVGPNQYALSESSPRIVCRRGLTSLGLRRRFLLESSAGGMLFSHSYWAGRGRDFFRWLAQHAQDPDWRTITGRQWSEGLSAAALRPD
jgi:hypothetical protein